MVYFFFFIVGLSMVALSSLSLAANSQRLQPWVEIIKPVLYKTPLKKLETQDSSKCSPG